jgi:hypothetical protein
MSINFETKMKKNFKEIKELNDKIDSMNDLMRDLKLKRKELEEDCIKELEQNKKEIPFKVVDGDDEYVIKIKNRTFKLSGTIYEKLRKLFNGQLKDYFSISHTISLKITKINEIKDKNNRNKKDKEFLNILEKDAKEDIKYDFVIRKIKI